MPEISVSDGARKLGLDPSRVRVLLQKGDLRGRKVGARWLLDEESARARGAEAVSEGRPFSPRMAWGYLSLLSGESAPWLDPASRSRLRSRIRHEPVRYVVPRLRSRAHAEYYRASLAAISSLRSQREFVLSGVSAAAEHGASISASEQLEGYIPASQLKRLAYRLALAPVEPASANVILRVSKFPLGLQRRGIASAGVVAIDLLDSHDQRSIRAGNALAERLRADRRPSR